MRTDPTGNFIGLCICGGIVDRGSPYSKGKPPTHCVKCNQRIYLIKQLKMWRKVRHILAAERQSF